MNELGEKKIKLLLKDFLTNHKDYKHSSVYLDIYDDCDEIFQQVFSYFHERMNGLFEFMNKKSVVNKHYNAGSSRELINIIDELREIKKGLLGTDCDFEINNNYIKQIKIVQIFLKDSGGSLISDDYEKFNTIKYEPIFNLKNKDFRFTNIDSSIISKSGNITKINNYLYINQTRISELTEIQNDNYDLLKLIQYCKEINLAFSYEMYLSTGMILRALIDHIPPIFSKNSFKEVANNYGTKSFKDSMKNLENSSRKIADSFLHTPIRNKENLPNRTQVDFSNDLDVLLCEICRVLKK
ncbi:MAG: hypothetical protein BWX53_00071 [Parcubacteria group bacterium ADurb.Bin016]|nr:MAG: hypothetical protein BWX53_00071 [Parcubacteria group bacterium ADurb.Bin016]